MRSFIITFLLACLYIMDVTAGNVPIFVFYKDGKIEQFNSENLLKIETCENNCETSSQYYQRFILTDTIIDIDIANIDSVAFNPGNIIKPKSNVIRINEVDLPYILGYDGSSILYGKQTPESIIPPKGAKIYYDAFCDYFPYGLCARVDNITQEQDFIRVDITTLSPAEVFDEYFVYGDYEMTIPEEALSKKGIAKASSKGGIEFQMELAQSDFTVKPSGYITLRFENFIGSPIRNYYHCDIYAGYDVNLDFTYKSAKSASKEYATDKKTLYRTIIGGIFAPQIAMWAFADINASAQLSYNMHRSQESHYVWTHSGEYDRFALSDNKGSGKDESEAKLEIVLDGSVHLGIAAEFSLNTLFNIAGAGLRTKIGPALEGEFGFEVLNDLSREYDTAAYAKASVSSMLLTKVETYSYYRNLHGQQTEKKLPFTYESHLYERRLNLLPEFNTRSVKRNKPKNEVKPSQTTAIVEIASNSNTNIAYGLPVGFQLTDKNRQEIYEEIVEDAPYLSETEETQVFLTELELPSRNTEEIQVNPIFKYGDYTVVGRPSAIQEGGIMSPMFFNSCTANSYIAGGASIIGEHKSPNDSTVFIVGNLMPVCRPDTTFNNIQIDNSTVPFINDEGIPTGQDSSIFGKWTAKINEEPIVMELTEDLNCTYGSERGTIVINRPQSGVITLRFDNNRSIIISIVEVGSAEMKVRLNNKTPITFKRE